MLIADIVQLNPHDHELWTRYQRQRESFSHVNIRIRYEIILNPRDPRYEDDIIVYSTVDSLGSAATVIDTAPRSLGDFFIARIRKVLDLQYHTPSQLYFDEIDDVQSRIIAEPF